MKQNKGYELPSAPVSSEVEAGHASSLGPSVSASLLVPVLLNEEASHTRAREVLETSPDRKKNKVGNVCLVFRAHRSDSDLCIPTTYRRKTGVHVSEPCTTRLQYR